MSDAATGSQRGKKKMTPGRLFRRGLMGLAERVDFIALLRLLAHQPHGRVWLDRFSLENPPHHPDADAFLQRCLELTQAQLESEGVPATPAEIRAAAEDIACRYDMNTHRWAAGAVNTVFDQLFTQHDPELPFISPDRREIAHLETLKEHQRRGLGVVYLVNHSSHVDEFIADGLFHDLGAGLPLFAAGTNMMAIKSLAKVLMCAAYAVQRKGAGRVYLSTLFNYCRAISETGGQQGIFLEAWAGGARSRDGSLRYPRRLVTLRGAIACDADLVVQPVAISYSAVPEDLALAARQGGQCWFHGMGLGRTLLNLALHPKTGLWRSLKGIYGRAYITMTKPLLLSGLKEAHAQDQSGLALDEFVALAAIKEIARCKKVMASQLTARALLRARRQDQPDLVAALELERQSLAEYHQAAFGQEPDLEDFILHNPPQRVLADGLATLARRKVVGRSRRGGLPPVKSERGLNFYATHGDRRLYSPTAKENIVVVGAGDWGFALAYLVGNRMLEEKRYLNASLTLYDSRAEVAEQMGIHRNPPGRFADTRLPKNVFVTHDPASAFKKASEVILAIPMSQFASQVQTLLEHAEQPLRAVIAVCGLDPVTMELPCQVVERLARRPGLAPISVYSLVGPVDEEDLVKGRAATGVLAGPAEGLEDLADLFRCPPVRVLTAGDTLGTQLAGVLAQVYSLWGGFLQRTGRVKTPAQVGLYLAQASTEAISLAAALGARPETFSAASPAWISTFVAAGLAGPVLDLGRRLGKESKKKGDLTAAAAKLCRQEEPDRGLRQRAYSDLRLAALLASRHGLSLPILEEASQTLWGSQ